MNEEKEIKKIRDEIKWFFIIIVGIMAILIALIICLEIITNENEINSDNLCKEKGYDAGRFENFVDGKIVWENAELICYKEVEGVKQ